MVNNEDHPFTFTVDEASCHSAGYEASLRVDPSSQTIPPKSRYVGVLMCVMGGTTVFKEREVLV